LPLLLLFRTGGGVGIDIDIGNGIGRIACGRCRNRSSFLSKLCRNGKGTGVCSHSFGDRIVIGGIGDTIEGAEGEIVVIRSVAVTPTGEGGEEEGWSALCLGLFGYHCHRSHFVVDCYDVV